MMELKLQVLEGDKASPHYAQQGSVVGKPAGVLVSAFIADGGGHSGTAGTGDH